jgi:Fe-S cluster assembly iron-binding protein IscA
LISKELLEQAKPISVDFVHTPSGSGFRLTSALATPESACGGSCSTC